MVVFRHGHCHWVEFGNGTPRLSLLHVQSIQDKGECLWLLSTPPQQSDVGKRMGLGYQKLYRGRKGSSPKVTLLKCVLRD